MKEEVERMARACEMPDGVSGVAFKERERERERERKIA